MDGGRSRRAGRRPPRSRVRSERLPFRRAADSGRRVAIVGGGPAGLSCAHRLALLGHAVSVFEARAKLGGLNEFGIAAYETSNDFVQREIDRELKAVSQWLDGHRALLGLVVHDLRRHGAIDEVAEGHGHAVQRARLRKPGVMRLARRPRKFSAVKGARCSHAAEHKDDAL